MKNLWQKPLLCGGMSACIEFRDEGDGRVAFQITGPFSNKTINYASREEVQKFIDSIRAGQKVIN